MYQVSRVQTALSGLIGWKQPYSDFFTLSTTNTASSSGFYFSDFSPLLEVQNIKDLQEDTDINQAEFNAMLGSIKRTAINKVCHAVFNRNDFCETKMVFDVDLDWDDKEENDDFFVGYELTPPVGNYIVTINTVKTYFDAADTLKLMLFHSSQQTPLSSKEITLVENTEVETTLSWLLTKNYGKYYIGYLRGNMTARGVYAEDVNIFNTIRLRGMKVPHTTETLFDEDDVQETWRTYGLNFEISTLRDYTRIIELNTSKFVNAIGYQAAIDVADMIIKSTRSNFKERNLRAVAMMEKEGLISNDPLSPKVNSLVQMLKKELTELNEMFTKNYALTKGTL
jgi:hypothetical protein